MVNSRCSRECGCAVLVPQWCHAAAVPRVASGSAALWIPLWIRSTTAVTTGPIFPLSFFGPNITSSLSLHPTRHSPSLCLTRPHRLAVVVPLCHTLVVSRWLLAFLVLTNSCWGSWVEPFPPFPPQSMTKSRWNPNPFRSMSWSSTLIGKWFLVAAWLG